MRVGTLFDVAKYKSDLKHLNNNHINDSQRKIRNGLAQMRFAIQIKWFHAADLWIVAENEANKNKQTTDWMYLLPNRWLCVVQCLRLVYALIHSQWLNNFLERRKIWFASCADGIYGILSNAD